MRQRGDVADRGDPQPSTLQRTKRGFAPSSWTGQEHFHALETVFHRFFGGVFCRDTRSVRSRFTRSLEATRSGARPRKCVTVGIGDRHDRIVERRLNMNATALYIFADFALRFGLVRPGIISCLPCRYFFFFAIVRFGPRLVRAFVRVRCPRLGKLRR